MHLQARKAAIAAVVAVVACNVYDPTLLVGGGDRGLGSGGTAGRGGGSGKSGTAGSGGTTGGTTTAGNGGTAGSSVAGGVNGGRAGRGGANGGANASGTAGSDNLGGAGADGGEAGMNGEGGSVSAGTGGTLGGGGQGGTAGDGGRGGAGGAGGTAGAGGRGGSAGASGSASGGAGSGGTAGTGGSAGTGGAAGSGGSGGVPTATGCARLTVPLNDSADKAHFVITLGSVADFRAATITMRVYIPTGIGGVIFSYVQEDGNFRFLGTTTAERTQLSTIDGSWKDITWDVGAAVDTGSPAVNKQTIRRIGIEVNASPSSSWTDPTVIYVDSITANTPTPLSFTFDATGSVNTSTSLTDNTGNTALWINSASSDTTATPIVASAWLATCPP